MAFFPPESFSKGFSPLADLATVSVGCTGSRAKATNVMFLTGFVTVFLTIPAGRKLLGHQCTPRNTPGASLPSVLNASQLWNGCNLLSFYCFQNFWVYSQAVAHRCMPATSIRVRCPLLMTPRQPANHDRYIYSQFFSPASLSVPCARHMLTAGSAIAHSNLSMAEVRLSRSTPRVDCFY